MPRAALLLLSLCCSCITLCYTTGAAATFRPLVSSGLITGVLVRVVLVVGALLLARFIYQQLRLYWLSRHLPGPSPTLPLLGNILTLCIPQEDLLNRIMAMREQYGLTWRFWIGPNLRIICCDPEDLRVLFLRNINVNKRQRQAHKAVSSHPHLQNKANSYKAILSVLGDGLISIDVPAYNRHRKALTPAMNQESLKNFVPKFARHSSTFADALQPHLESGATFDALALTDILVCKSTCESLLGMEVDLFREDFDRVNDALQPGSELLLYLMLRPWFAKSKLLMRLLAPERYEEWKYYSEELHGVVERVVARKERQLQDRSQQRGPARDLLEYVLTSKEGVLMDREELLSELKHFIVTSTSSSSQTLALLMLSLSLEPKVQATVQQELDEVFAEDPSRPVTADDLQRLRYLEMTIKEVLRYFPQVPVYGRTAQEDVQLPSGTLLPRGCQVMVFQKAVHWDPRWYPDPSKFDPERFLPELVDARPNFTYIAFSAGLRNCIGQRYAMLFIKAVAATILRKYSFLPDPNGLKSLKDVKTVMGIGLHVTGGINVRVERRKNL